MKRLQAQCIACLFAVTSVATAFHTKKDGLLHFPKSTLILGWPEAAYLTATTPKDTIHLLPSPYANEKQKYKDPHFFSVSRDGEMIAYVIGGIREDTLVTYSLHDRRRTEWTKARTISSVAISPNKSKIAFIGHAFNMSEEALHILDLKTRDIYHISSSLCCDNLMSWSPDGKRLVFEEDDPEAETNDIYIMETATRKVTLLTEGGFPSWSPSGEWIAFVGRNEPLLASYKQCVLIRPDGTQKQVVAELSDTDQDFHLIEYSPVWSPDSEKLLLNDASIPKSIIENYQTINPYEINVAVWTVDIAKHSKQMILNDTVPVLGWGGK